MRKILVWIISYKWALAYWWREIRVDGEQTYRGRRLMSDPIALLRREV